MVSSLTVALAEEVFAQAQRAYESEGKVHIDSLPAGFWHSVTVGTIESISNNSTEGLVVTEGDTQTSIEDKEVDVLYLRGKDKISVTTDDLGMLRRRDYSRTNFSDGTSFEFSGKPQVRFEEGYVISKDGSVDLSSGSNPEKSEKTFVYYPKGLLDSLRTMEEEVVRAYRGFVTTNNALAQQEIRSRTRSTLGYLLGFGFGFPALLAVGERFSGDYESWGEMFRTVGETHPFFGLGLVALGGVGILAVAIGNSLFPTINHPILNEKETQVSKMLRSIQSQDHSLYDRVTEGVKSPLFMSFQTGYATV